MAVKLVPDVMIGGFIINGMEPKKVVVRALGPTLTTFNVPRIANPTLSSTAVKGLIASNDNWRTSNPIRLIDSGLRCSK